MEEQGALHIAWQPTTEGLLDELGAQLLALVDRHQAKRVLIDSFGGMAKSVSHPARLTEFFSALMGEMRARGVLVFATWEIRGLFGPKIDAPSPDLSSIVDNVLLMRFVEHGFGQFEYESELKRMLAILKMRDSSYDTRVVEIIMADKRVELRKALNDAQPVWPGSTTTMSTP
jgi:circadian clock protein KaiC